MSPEAAPKKQLAESIDQCAALTAEKDAAGAEIARLKAEVARLVGAEQGR